MKVYKFPVTLTVIQFAVGTVLVLLMWTLNLYKRPKISRAQVCFLLFFFIVYILKKFRQWHLLWVLFTLQLAAILPLALVHTLGNLFTNMSLGKVAVSFTHTIKATEPFFSVVLSAMFLGEVCFFFNFLAQFWFIVIYLNHLDMIHGDKKWCG